MCISMHNTYTQHTHIFYVNKTTKRLTALYSFCLSASWIMLYWCRLCCLGSWRQTSRPKPAGRGAVGIPSWSHRCMSTGQKGSRLRTPMEVSNVVCSRVFTPHTPHRSALESSIYQIWSFWTDMISASFHSQSDLTSSWCTEDVWGYKMEI